MAEILTPFFQDVALKYPLLLTLISIMGVCSAIFKPTMSLLEAFVLATPSKTDDEELHKFQESKVYKTLVWLVDYIARVKIDKFIKPKPAAFEDINDLSKPA